MPLSKASSWTYSLEAPVGSTTVNVYILYDGNEVIESNNSNSYVAQGIQIQWIKARVGDGQSDKLEQTGGYTTFGQCTYNWQVSTDNGKTWTDVKNGTGSIYGGGTLTSETVQSMKINDIDNSTTQYRLQLINDSNPSQILYSNVITTNDSLITANLSFNNANYQSEFTSKTWGSAIISTNQTQFYLNVNLNQFGKNITKTLNLKNVSATITINYVSSLINNDTYYGGNDPFYINVTDLSQYLQNNDTLLIPVNINNIIQNLNAMNQALNENGLSTSNAYQPCQISFSINQGNLNIASTTSLSAIFETATINLTSNATEINGVYYVPWDQQVSLTSANSMLSFNADAQIQYQWQVSTDNKNWQSLENGTKSTYSGSNNYNQLYYRLKITSLQGSDMVLYSNVIEISSAIPTATLKASNNTDAITVNSFNPVPVILQVNQYNAPIASSNDIQVVYQSYDSANSSWKDLTEPENYNSSSSTYNVSNLVSGTNKVRAEYIFMGKISNYSNPVTITELIPSISPANNLNPVGNVNNYVSKNGSTYTYIAGSVVQLDINHDGLFNSNNINNYQIQSIAWYEKGNDTALATYNSNNYSIGPNSYDGYAFRATNSNASYYAIISYENLNTGAYASASTNSVTIDTINNGTTANIELSNISSLQTNYPGEYGQYYFFNMSNYFYENYQNGYYSVPNLNFSLSIYQNGKKLDFNESDSTIANWETTWYIENYSNSVWADPTTLQNTSSLSTSSAASCTYNLSNYIEDGANNNINAPAVRIRCLITEGTTQIYSQWYYIGEIPVLGITQSYS